MQLFLDTTDTTVLKALSLTGLDRAAQAEVLRLFPDS